MTSLSARISARWRSAGRGLAMAALLAGAMGLAIGEADARASRGGSFGSRGTKTYSAPPSTNTAPSAVQPMQRTTTPQTAPRPYGQAAGAAAGRQGAFGSMGRGFMGGLLAAGLFGALLGYGLGGGLGGVASFLGLLLQVGLLVMLASFVLSWWRNRQNPAAAGMARQRGLQGGAAPAPDYAREGAPGAASRYAGSGQGMGGLGMGGQELAPTRPLQLTGADFTTFEALLKQVQDLYAREDKVGLARIATGEMAGYLAQDIDETIRAGHAMRVSDVQLLQGDLSEAWKEPDAEYATVAMRFSMKDAIVDRSTGRVVEGSLTQPTEATEVWTFVRRPGASPRDWLLSAIQQTQHA